MQNMRVTGTFHGAVFSMLNHRDFACSLTNPSRAKKVRSLLKEFGLDNRQTNGNADRILKVLENPIDYKVFDEIANRRINESIEI